MIHGDIAKPHKEKVMLDVLHRLPVLNRESIHWQGHPKLLKGYVIWMDRPVKIGMHGQVFKELCRRHAPRVIVMREACRDAIHREIARIRWKLQTCRRTLFRRMELLVQREGDQRMARRVLKARTELKDWRDAYAARVFQLAGAEQVRGIQITVQGAREDDLREVSVLTGLFAEELRLHNGQPGQ